jgi:class 3 adenylate cyclase
MDPAAASADAFLVVGLFASGCGLIFGLADRHSRSSRALALCLIVLGIRLQLAPLELDAARGHPVLLAGLTRGMEVFCLLTGIEWARRVAETATRKLRGTIHWLFRAAQILMLVYGGLALGYLWLDPADATSGLSGLIRVRPLEWAIFAPVLGAAALVAAIAIFMLLITRTDPAESIRLRALLLAGPLFFASLMVRPSLVPVLIALALLIVLAGSLRYLNVLSRRGQFMSQFLAPEVAGMVRLKGIERALKRERRLLSAVFCDLRGFTAYTQERSSEEVMNLLERYYAAVGAAAAAEGGTVKDHAGDGVLILLGAPVAQRDHAARAVRLGIALIEQLRPLLRQLAPEIGLGVGIASGAATVGAIHGAGRLEYVAVGSAINLAARLCQRAEDGELLIDQASRQSLATELAARFVARPPEAIKGYEEAVMLHALQPRLAA